MFLVLVLLAQLAVETPPAPVQVNTPFQHWSCPVGWYVPDKEGIQEQKCVKITAGYLKLTRIDPTKEEEIAWQLTPVIPETGTFHVDFDPQFQKTPPAPRASCVLANKEVISPLFFDANDAVRGVTIVGPAGAHLILNCRGVVKRNP